MPSFHTYILFLFCFPGYEPNFCLTESSVITFSLCFHRVTTKSLILTATPVNDTATSVCCPRATLKGSIAPVHYSCPRTAATMPANNAGPANMKSMATFIATLRADVDATTTRMTQVLSTSLIVQTVGERQAVLTNDFLKHVQNEEWNAHTTDDGQFEVYTGAQLLTPMRDRKHAHIASALRTFRSYVKSWLSVNAYDACDPDDFLASFTDDPKHGGLQLVQDSTSRHLAGMPGKLNQYMHTIKATTHPLVVQEEVPVLQLLSRTTNTAVQEQLNMIQARIHRVFPTALASTWSALKYELSELAKLHEPKELV